MTADDRNTELAEVGARELRLALVCYGGVSLAIYMHGITKEIHKLVKASTVLHERPGAADALLSGSERVYYDLLARIARGEAGRRAGTRIRVVVDIISGTSAGGINGVFLAKALAHNRTLDPLKVLWFEKGDISQLLRGWKRLPKVARIAWVIRPKGLNPPLRGDDMCRWLHQALSEMDDRDPELRGFESLMPTDHELQLFVPVTDYAGYDRDVPLYDPRFLRDRSHRHVMRFRRPGAGEAPSQLARDSNHVLAFAARATSSFPGAFPPINFAEYERAVGGDPGLAQQARAYFPHHRPDRSDPSRTYFIDGGVLDNAPFGSAINALTGKPAAREVDRRLIFVQPDPTPKKVKPLKGMPRLTATVFQGYAGIPRKEPILDEILSLWERNEAVLRIRDVIEDQFPSIEARVVELLDRLGAKDVFEGEASGERLGRLRRDIEDLAVEEAGFGAATYLRQRVRSMVDGYAAAVCNILELPTGSSEASFVLAALRRWAAEAGLLTQDADEETARAQREFLGALDLGYHRRRVSFLVAAASWLYHHLGKEGVPTRAELDEAKDRLYARRATIDGFVGRLVAETSVKADLRAVFNPADLDTSSAEDEYDVAKFVGRHSDDLATIRDRVASWITGALPNFERELYDDVMWFRDRCGSTLPDDLLTRYLGFPFWDVLVFPLQALSGVGERDHVEVYRMSPADVDLVEVDLSGMRLGHFGAFFDAPGRQRDYLAGRLHAAERLVKLLLDVRREPSTVALPDPAVDRSRVEREELVAECVPALRAILAEEARDLDKAKDLIDEVDGTVAALEREVPSRAATARPGAGGG